MAWDLSHQEVTECLRASRMCKTSGSTDPTDLASFGEEVDNEPVKLKKYVQERVQKPLGRRGRGS